MLLSRLAFLSVLFLSSRVEGVDSFASNPHPTRRALVTASSTTKVRTTAISLPFPIEEPEPAIKPVSLDEAALSLITQDAASSTDTPTADATGTTKLELCLAVAYFCDMMAVSMPVVGLGSMANGAQLALAPFVASVAAAVPLGGFGGKVLNGFVCQHLGGRPSSLLYLGLLSLTSLALSMVPSAMITSVPWFFLLFEFWSSVQWIALMEILVNQSKGTANPAAAISRGTAKVGMGGLLGTLGSKLLGASVLAATGQNWRIPCRVGAGLALVGALAVSQAKSTVPDDVDSIETSPVSVDKPKNRPKKAGISLKLVLMNPLFWLFATAQALSDLARGSDLLLGAFLQELSSLPAALCASLTACVPLGMMHGLFRGGQVFDGLKTRQAKASFVQRQYQVGALSAVGMAVVAALPGLRSFLGPWGMAGWMSICGFLLADSVSVAYHQFPNTASQVLAGGGRQASVVLAWTDAWAYWVTAQGVRLQRQLLVRGWWPMVWASLAMVFATLGRFGMTHAMNRFWSIEEGEEEMNVSPAVEPSPA